MPLVTEKIRNILKEKNFSQNELARRVGYKHGPFGSIIRGERPIPEDVLPEIAFVLEISPEEIIGWIVMEKYPKHVLERALQLKQEYVGEDQLIVDTKIRELMKPKNFTITAFAEEIGCNQGRLSQIMLGKKPVSPKLMQQLCSYSGISEDEIKSWGIADKYSVEALQFGVR